jgi:adenosylcobinamide-phosphate synthase
MAEPVALAALALDAAIGWPDRFYARIGHPVGGFARLIAVCERHWNLAERGQVHRWAMGVVTLALLAGGTGLTALAIEAAIRQFAGGWAWPLIALAAWPALAQRSLLDHYRPVLAALERGDLNAAREAVSLIVGRDTDMLGEAEVTRAAIESLAESFCDGIVAPLFWFLVLGLPGIWAFKAVSTADSLIGHPEEPWSAFGWASARCDDVLNLIPARLSAVLICLAGGGGWRVLWRDHARHASPNAGWPEAAMAGALNVTLAGPVSYGGLRRDKPWIGHGPAPTVASMHKARAVFLRACVLLWLLAGGIAWAL